MTTIYVRGSKGKELIGDGTIEKPYNHLQKAIDMASNGDVIKVAAGDYGKIKADKFNLNLQGGYAPDFSVSRPHKFISLVEEYELTAGKKISFSGFTKGSSKTIAV